MKLFVPRGSESAETRVALTPRVTNTLVADGVEVLFEAGIGAGAFLHDADFVAAGAAVADDAAAAWSAADVVVALAPPTQEQAGRMKTDALLIGLLSPTRRPGWAGVLAERGVSSMALELVPRISRAQAMDVLSSQASLAGYRAALLGAQHCPKLMPMMMTAAGTLSPARVFVIGAGVAGLQAIATAKRLGAVVEAFDVRAATREQVQSLGARFVELKGRGGQDKAPGDAEDAGGYAKAQSDDEKAQQAAAMAKHVTGADVVIATAAVFGGAPPMLIPGAVVDAMRPGAVLVDMAADVDAGRGNCERTRPGEVWVTEGGVTVVGTLNLAGTLAVHASEVLANNVLALLKTLLVPATPAGAEAGEGDAATEATPAGLKINVEDEIHAGALVTHAGAVVNDRVREALEKDGK